MRYDQACCICGIPVTEKMIKEKTLCKHVAGFFYLTKEADGQ